MATETEGRGTREATTAEVIEGLNDLLKLDHDAVNSYTVAIERLQDGDYADQIRGFRREHQRHIEELNAQISALGGSPTNEPHATGPLKAALQGLGGAAGDKGVLVAFRANELQVRTKYDSYAQKANHWPSEVKALVDRNALDEERHYRWVADTLQALGVGMGEGPETHLANRARETAAKVGSATDRVRRMGEDARQRASDAAAGARSRAASGLDTAADRVDRFGSQQESSGGARARLGRPAHGAAGGLHSAAEYLRTGDAEQLRADIEADVRRNPLRGVLTTFAIGFVIGRILR